MINGDKPARVTNHTNGAPMAAASYIKHYVDDCTGFTKREEIARSSMQGVITSGEFNIFSTSQAKTLLGRDIDLGSQKDNAKNYLTIQNEMIATKSVKLADALLEALKRPV